MKFRYVSKLVREARKNTPWSQADVAAMVYGNKNFTQMISNTERGKCSVPKRKIAQTAVALRISERSIKKAIIKDFISNMGLD